MKKSVVAILTLLLIAFTTVCFAAESYQMTYEAKNFTEELKTDQALSETFTTSYGTLKFQMRKLMPLNNDKRLHLLVWLDGKKIDDEYFPKVDYGYTFRVIKNTSNSEQFYVLQSIDRVCLLGYSPDAKKLIVYIDSQNYAHERDAYPYIVALENGNLVLVFEKSGRCQRYRFTWDADAKWFGYSDLGAGWGSIAKDKQ